MSSGRNCLHKNKWINQSVSRLRQSQNINTQNDMFISKENTLYAHKTNKYFQHGKETGLNIFFVLQQWSLNSGKSLQRSPSRFQREMWSGWFPLLSTQLKGKRKNSWCPQCWHMTHKWPGDHSGGTAGPLWQNAPPAASFCTCLQLWKARRRWIGDTTPILKKKKKKL